MHRLISLVSIALAASLTLLLASAAGAQTSKPTGKDAAQRESSEDRWESESQRRDEPLFSTRFGAGVAIDPSTFLLTVEMPWRLADSVSFGPLLQLGVSDDDVYFAPTLQLYAHPLLEGGLEPLRPYGHAGIGLAHLESEHRRTGRDDEDTDFQFTAGLGFEYALREDFFMGTGMLFNVIPAGVAGEKFVFSWQMLTFRQAF